MGSFDHRLSIIIPVLGEAERITALVDALCDQQSDGRCEIIVVDGDPDGGTIQVIHHRDVISVVSPKGRARQMNAGAALAQGENLLFLHADTRLPDGAFNRISTVLAQKQYVAGAFDLGIDSDRWALKVVACFASLRSRITRIPYGDQAIFMRKDYFTDIGGYQDIPLMEDVELMHRIKKRGERIAILSDRVSTSPRRWEREGIIYCTLRDWVLATLYSLGVSPDRLARFYRSGGDVYRS